MNQDTNAELQKDGGKIHGTEESSDQQGASPNSADTEEEQNSMINPARRAQIDAQTQQPRISKTQMKKRAKFAPKPPPPKPVLPAHIPMIEGEENWLALWDLDDDELERRVMREKKRKAANRKALRLKQQSGKDERRMARDERRKVYRELKQEWRNIKGAVTGSSLCNRSC